MSDSDFERRINNQLATIVENQARFDENMVKIQEAIAGLIQVARVHDEQIDALVQQDKEAREELKESRKQLEESRNQLAEMREQIKETRDNLNALIRVVEQHITDHP